MPLFTNCCSLSVTRAVKSNEQKKAAGLLAADSFVGHLRRIGEVTFFQQIKQLICEFGADDVAAMLATRGFAKRVVNPDLIVWIKRLISELGKPKFLLLLKKEKVTLLKWIETAGAKVFFGWIHELKSQTAAEMARTLLRRVECLQGDSP
jgi:hypothetical protein